MLAYLRPCYVTQHNNNSLSTYPLEFEREHISNKNNRALLFSPDFLPLVGVVVVYRAKHPKVLSRASNPLCSPSGRDRGSRNYILSPRSTDSLSIISC